MGNEEIRRTRDREEAPNHDAAAIALCATRLATDSPAEGDGFKLLVPGRETVKPSWGDRTAVLTTAAELSRNRWFESVFLQGRVRQISHPLGRPSSDAASEYLITITKIEYASRSPSDVFVG